MINNTDYIIQGLDTTPVLSCNPVCEKILIERCKQAHLSLNESRLIPLDLVLIMSACFIIYINWLRDCLKNKLDDETIAVIDVIFLKLYPRASFIIIAIYLLMVGL